jgi:hypothetical protein
MLGVILNNTSQKYKRQEGTSVENQNFKKAALLETEKGYISDIDIEINETVLRLQEKKALSLLSLISLIWQSAEEALCRCKKNP